MIVTLPFDGTDEQVIRTNAWMIKQVLATGIHGILLCHAENPEAVKALVEWVRYPFQTIGIGEGTRSGKTRLRRPGFCRADLGCARSGVSAEGGCLAPEPGGRDSS